MFTFFTKLYVVPFPIPTICNKLHIDILKNAPLSACWKTGHQKESPCIIKRQKNNYLVKATESIESIYIKVVYSSHNKVRHGW